MKVLPSCPNHLPKASFPNTNTLGIRFEHVNFSVCGRGTQSVYSSPEGWVNTCQVDDAGKDIANRRNTTHSGRSMKTEGPVQEAVSQLVCIKLKSVERSTRQS